MGMLFCYHRLGSAALLVLCGSLTTLCVSAATFSVIEDDALAVPPDHATTALRSQLRDKYCNNNNSAQANARIRVYFFKEAFWKAKAELFRQLTCANVEVVGGAYSPLEMKDDMTGPGLFAGYVHDGNLIPDFVKLGGVLDLTDRVQSLLELEWYDVLPNGPRQVVAYDNKVWGIPLDGDVIYQVYRKDLLLLPSAQNNAQPPKTWLEFVHMAEHYHGKDLNGDGVPDYGVCFSTAFNDIGHQMFWAVAAPYLQTQGTNSGMWFDVESFEPSAASPTFLGALSLWKRLVLASPYVDNGPTDWTTNQQIMLEGRCALYINYPGPIKQLVTAISEAEKDNSTNTTGTGATSLLLGGGNLQLARLPGVECDELRAMSINEGDSIGTTGEEDDSGACPFAIEGINYAPFYAGGGQCATIRLGDEDDDQQRLMHQIVFDLFAFVADPEVSYWDVANPASLLDPYRTSHVEPLNSATSKEALAFEHFGWDPSQLEALRAETMFVFNHPNGAKDLAVAPFDYQHEATMHNLLQFVDGDASLEDTQANVVREWKIVTQRFTLQEHRDEYRKYLGLGSYEESLLANQQHEYNYLGNIRWIGLSMSAIIMVLSSVFAVWVWASRLSRTVRVSQPPFLYMICFGTFAMGSSIIPMAIDDEIATQEGCNASCMAFPWLLSLGFVITFSALFSKIWRISKVLKNASKFKRIKITERDVIIPFAILFAVTALVMVLWTAVEPMVWERHQVSSSPLAAESYGRCTFPGTASKVFAVLNLGIVFSSLILAVRQAYQARALSDEFSESAYIGIGIVGWLQVFMVGIPLVFLVDEKTTAAFVVKSGMIFVVCTSILCLVFIPKIRLNWEEQALATGRQRVVLSLRSSQNRGGSFATSSSPHVGLNAIHNAGSDRDDGLRFVSVAPHPHEEPEAVENLKKENARLKEYTTMLQGLLAESGISVPHQEQAREDRTAANAMEETDSFCT